jgi:putative flippase GtrA
MTKEQPLLRRAFSWLASFEKIRFAAVGAVNTLVDFAVFLSLASVLHVPTVIANIISTTCALCVSYVLNKKAVFGDTDSHNYRQIATFVVVTLTGLWLIQSVIIVQVSSWLVTVFGSETHAPLVLLAAKLIASVVSLVWNYVWYSRVVFRKK